ncbi:MAG: endonuclease [Chitinophagaceae bacterium]|nr:endonuclease [Chitinophagaceae bacterium]
MPEGPSIIIAREDIERFTGKKILSASGSSKINMDRLVNNKIVEIRTWGKHLLLCFRGFTLRVHFLMFGKYLINSSKPLKSRLSLKFSNGQELNFYTSAIKEIEEPLDEIYDWTADIMNDQWNPAAAKKKMQAAGDKLIADVLMDQQIFSGLGNIIKNEVLYRARVHPKSITQNIPSSRINIILTEVKTYVFEFLLYKKAYVLAAHWEVYTKKKCPRDGAAIRKEYIGTQQRRCFFCDQCQVVY